METESLKGKVIWFYGLSGAGKTTTANEFIEANRKSIGEIVVLDGDTFREDWCSDLGFSISDRYTNIVRACAVAKEVSDRGITVIASFNTPFRMMREHLRNILGDKLILTFVDTPLEVCMERDPKGLYKRALAGEIKNMIGIDIPFEV